MRECRTIRLMKPAVYILAATVVIPLAVLATDIEGVQMAALDQPRVTVMLKRDAQGKPLASKGDPAMAQLLGMDKNAAESVTSFAAFLDTGASGISISEQTADGLGIRRLEIGRTRTVFFDVGVGGSAQFNVSEPLHVSVGSYQALGAPAADESFQYMGGPWNTQIGPLGGGGLLGALLGGIDVLGMPAMNGRVVILDPKPVNSFGDVMRAGIFPPDYKSIPQTNRTVRLNYGDFAPFTRTEPANAPRPMMSANPFIGPPPNGKPGPGGITLRHNGKTSTAGWLLDTGAAASMISTRQAAAIGIRYKAGSTTILEGVPANKQFTLTIGGIGGQKQAGGFFVDELRIPTAQGDDLVYRPAPVLVADISVEHPQTHQKITLDGVFGMNFLVASAHITEGIAPDIGKMSQGAYDWIVIDHARGTLGLKLRKELLTK